MAKKINMNIEDLKRLGKTSGQINKTLSEVYGYSVTRYKFIRRTYNGCKGRKQIAWKFTEGHRKALNLWMSQNSDLAARGILKLFQKEMYISFSLSNIRSIEAICDMLFCMKCSRRLVNTAKD